MAVFTASDLPTVPIHEIALIPESFAQPALADGEVRFAGEYVVAIVAETRRGRRRRRGARRHRVLAAPRGHRRSCIRRRRALVGRARGRRRVRRRRGHDPRVVLHPAPRGGADGGPGDPRGPDSESPDGAFGSRCTRRRRRRTGRARSSRARSISRSTGCASITPHVGGGFGGKAVGGVPAYVIAAAAALRLGRAVRYVEGARRQPREHAGPRAALRRRAPRRAVTAPSSASRSTSAATRAPTPRPARSSRARPTSWRAARTGSRRSRSGPGACAPTSRPPAPTAGRAARRPPRCSSARSTCSRRDLGLDPAVIRARNLVTPAELPAESPTGAHYDDGDFPALLDELLEHAGYGALRRRADASARGTATRARSASGSRPSSTPLRGSRARRPRA